MLILIHVCLFLYNLQVGSTVSFPSHQFAADYTSTLFSGVSLHTVSLQIFLRNIAALTGFFYKEMYGYFAGTKKCP